MPDINQAWADGEAKILERISTVGIIAELKKRRPCANCITIPCCQNTTCVWFSSDLSDNFKPSGKGVK